MRINLGAAVICQDGRSGMRIQQLILEAQSKEIVYFVIGTRTNGPLSLLPPNLIERSRDGAIFVRMDKERLHELPEYVESQWVGMVTQLAPPVEPDKGGAKLPSGWLLTQEGFPYGPDTIPRHTSEPKPAGHVEEMPRATISLKKYTRVECADCRLGILKGVGLDIYQNKVNYIISRKGILFPKETTIPIEWVVGVSPNTVRVGADKEQIKSLVGPPSGPYLSIFGEESQEHTGS